MRGILHFAVVTAATIASIQLALKAMDLMGVDVQPGFGLDDVIEGALVALGVSLTLSLYKTIGKAA